MVGFRVPGFDVDEQLSRGWGGELWSARGRATGRRVVLRRLDVPDDVASHDRVRRAAARLVGVEHPHLVGVCGVLSAQGALVLVHDHVAGVALDRWLAEHGPMTAAEVVTLVVPLAEALAALHARGISHGRVSSAAVFIGDDGRPMLADAGVAALLDGGDRANGPPDDVHDLALAGAAALDGREQNSDLASVLRAATVDDVARRPAAADLAAAVFATGPTAPFGSSSVPAQRAPARPDADRRDANGANTDRPDASRADPSRAGLARSHRRPVRGSSRRWVGLLVAAAAVMAAAALTGLAWAGVDPGAPGSAVAAREPPTPQPEESAVDGWRAVLVSLDARRAAAFAAASQRRLADVYAVGAPALRRDQARLAQLTAAGLHVERLNLRPQSVRVQSVAKRRVLLDVVDVLQPYELRTARGALDRVQPGRAATSWRVTLVRGRNGWRIYDVVAL